MVSEGQKIKNLSVFERLENFTGRIQNFKFPEKLVQTRRISMLASSHIQRF